jgi:hypothetical protein
MDKALVLAFTGSFGFSFPFHAGFHVVLTAFDFRKNTCFLDFLFETLQCTFDTFTRLDLDFCQFSHPLCVGFSGHVTGQ